jgi:hypothetical protein
MQPVPLRLAAVLALMAAGGSLSCTASPEPPSGAMANDIDQDDDDNEPSLAGCGVERWSVKTGTDGDVARVDPTVVDTTIAALGGATPPGSAPSDARVAPQELTTYRLRDVTLVTTKHESDGDVHLVLQDGAHTMVAEVPNPMCVGASSPFAAAIAKARAAVDGHTVSAGETISLTGVGFFDRPHGQTGDAPNSIELHPVLAICFGAGCASAQQ